VFAPRNGTVIVVLFVCAITGGALFWVLELTDRSTACSGPHLIRSIRAHPSTAEQTQMGTKREEPLPVALVLA
jgi:hypothetical protein